MRHLILSFSCITLLLTCGIVHAQMNPAATTPQEQGIIDANLDVQQQVSGARWFLAGLGCGIFAFTYAVVDTPQVPTTRLLGKSAAYITAYTAEYQAKAKSKRLKNSGFGWGTWVILYLAYIASIN